MDELTNLFSTDFTDIPQVECNMRELESNIKKLKDRIKELESVDRGLYVGYLSYEILDSDYDEEECSEYYIFGDMFLSEAREKLENITIDYDVEVMHSMEVIKLPEDIFNLFKTLQQLIILKQGIDNCRQLPELDNSGYIYYEPFGNVKPIMSGLKEEINKVRAELNEKMKAQEMWFDEYAKIY